MPDLDSAPCFLKYALSENKNKGGNITFAFLS